MSQFYNQAQNAMGSMKRAYPGDWGQPIRPTKEPFTQGFEPRGGGFESQSGFYSGNFTQAAPPELPYFETQWTINSSNNTSCKMDFTDDYSADSQPRGRGFQGKDNNIRGWGGRGKVNQNQTQYQPQNQINLQKQNKGENQGRGRWFRGQFRSNRRGGQRGINQNQFGGGQGCEMNMNASFTQPINKPAPAKPLMPDIVNMPVAEKLHRFCLFLKNANAMNINPIQTVMNAITSSKLGLKPDYEAEELTKIGGKPMYTGVLKLNDVFLSRAIRPNKKELKQEVFQKALDMMLSMTVAEIYNTVDPGAEAIREELERQIKEEAKNKIPAVDPAAAVKCFKGTDIENQIAVTLNQLVKCLNNMKNIPNNAISCVEQASTQAHTVLKHEFKMEPEKMASGRVFYRGSLVLGGVFIGRGHGLNKKMCKNDTYTKTLERLKTKPIEELMISVPEEPDPGYMKDAPVVAKMAVSNLPLEVRFAEFIKALLSTSYKSSCVNQIDTLAMHNGLSPMVIYKKDPQPKESGTYQICELYIEKVFIASSDGKKRRECMQLVYTTAWDILTTTSVETILQQHRRITEEEMKNPEFLEVNVKGSGQSIDSNTAGLRRYGYDLTAAKNNMVSNLVIVEHNDWAKDRMRNALCILQFSCTQNGLLLQWETDSVKNCFKCIISIQKQPMGYSYGTTKTHARNLAAADALFKLYETNPVVKIAPRLEDQNVWITYDDIKAEAEKLKAENVGAEPIMKTDEQGNQLPDKCILKVLMGKLDGFIETCQQSKESGELLFGPGVTLSEARELRAHAKNAGIRSDSHQFQGHPYLVFYQKLELSKLVEVLKVTKKQYGKYILMDREDLPRHSDIEGNIKHELPTSEEAGAIGGAAKMNTVKMEIMT